MASAATLRRRLVRELEEIGLLGDRRIRQAFLDVPRERFVPEVGVEEAYRNEAILTKKTAAGHGLSSSSQPSIMAIMLERLQLEPGQRVLEIGAGTGYNAALLQHMVGDKGSVTAIDIDPDTAARARRALKGTRVKIVTGDGRAGFADGAPYDRIVVTASHDEVPHEWLQQLHPGGLVEVPLRLRGSDSLQLIPTLRREDGRLRSASVVVGGFMPLRGAPDDLSPYWQSLNVTLVQGADVTPLLSLYGEAVRSLSRAAARRLVSTACSEARVRSLRVRPSVDSFEVYFAVAAPRRQLVGVAEEKRFFAGLISRDGRSLALLHGRKQLGQMLVFGDDSAADEVERLVDEWQERGRPGVEDVVLTVSFRNGRSSIRTRIRGR